MLERLASRVLLIGWDAADWKIAGPLLDQGRMPHLQRLIENGVMGNLATLRPILSPMLWASIATGKRPHKHGIHGFLEPDPLRAAVRPVTSTSRTSKAVWNILMQNGLRSNVVGWFGSHPAEPISGVMVTDSFGKGASPDEEAPWPLPPATIHPDRLTEVMAEFRVHPGELDLESLIPFVPAAFEINQEKDKRLGVLAKNLAECVSIHTAATWLMENEPWNFTAVYHNCIDHICHSFMPYHPPRMENVPERDFELYRNVVNETYCFHDQLLGRLIELAGDDTTVILCSDHGYHSDHLRPPWTPKLSAGPAIWHRPYGIIVVSGPGIKRDERIYGSVLLDVAPTILRLFGLPVGADMDGRVLVQAFDQPVIVEVISSWEQAEGKCGMHPPERRLEASESAAILQQMVDLGYIDKPDEDTARALDAVRREAKFNLAQSLLDAGLPGEATPYLEELYANSPGHLLIGLNLATSYYRTGRRRESRQLAEALIARSRDPSQPAFGRPRLSPEEEAAFQRGTEGPRLIPQADLLLGMIDLEDGNLASALAHLHRAELADFSSLHVQTQLGRLYLRLHRWRKAETAFRKALAIDPDHAQAYDGLAEACLGQRRNEEAARHALDAVGLLHHLPAGHFHLGVALVRLKKRERAIQAFEMSLSIRPHPANPAYRWLRRLQWVSGLKRRS